MRIQHRRLIRRACTKSRRMKLVRCRANEFCVFSLTRAMLCGILKGKRFLPQKSSRSETMHRQLKRAAKMRYVYFLYISAMICILFAEKYTYPVKRWWKMTTNAQFDPNIPWDRAIEKRGAALPVNAAEGPSQRVASDELSPDGNAHRERKRRTRPVSMQAMSP